MVGHQPPWLTSNIPQRWGSALPWYAMFSFQASVVHTLEAPDQPGSAPMRACKGLVMQRNGVCRFPGIQPCSTSPSKNHLVRALTVQLCFSFSGKERLSAGSREICWDPIFLCYWTSVFVILSSMLAAVVTGNRDLCICKTSEHNPNNHHMRPCEFLKFTVLICNLEWNVCPRCCFQPTQWLWLELDWCFHSFSLSGWGLLILLSVSMYPQLQFHFSSYL